MTDHQLKQLEIINKVEKQIAVNSLSISMVFPTDDYENDSRICLTSVHLPHKELISQIQQSIIEPLRKVAPDLYYYSFDSLHITIKSIRVINSPPSFSDNDVQKAEKIFSEIIPKHKQFSIYFYRLLLFPNNLALIGTTDSELDKIIFNLDSALKTAGIPDDKVYANSKYFFSNITLARFNTSPSEEFKQKVQELPDFIKFKPYTVNSVTLLSCNGVFKMRQIKGTWYLKD